jgi:pSer/pThr/pTyr-binding forkhead associated (FHA) protein
MWKLVIEDDEGKRTVVPLTRDVYTVGRKEGNTIRLTERNVSRDHARIRKMNGSAQAQGHLTYALEDLQSYNGVFVNGLRVSGVQVLNHGDLIQIGDYRMILQDDTVTEEAPPPAITLEDHKSTIPTGQITRGSLLLERPNRLVMLAGPTPGMEYPLERERITIGRAEDCAISINHNSVSRLHCEIHVLGEGRFEIVDKGSSNGVRVNGRELKRGIIEAGDIIELGDVRFRFVGAGQVFVPGVNDSQQLMAIGDRVADRHLRPRSGGTVTGYIALGAVAAMVIVLGVWFVTHRQPSQPAAESPQNPEGQALARAKRLCIEQNDCMTAHDDLMTHISDGSPLRLSPDFKFIESKWANQMLDRAQDERDETRKRSILRQVEQATTAPEDARKVATTRLRELDLATSVVPSVSTSPPTLSIAMTTPPPPVTTTAPTRTQPTITANPTHAVSQPTIKPTAGKPPIERARELYLAGDKGGARAILEPRVFGHTATKEEISFLSVICKEQGDKLCRDKCKEMLNAP